MNDGDAFFFSKSDAGRIGRVVKRVERYPRVPLTTRRRLVGASGGGPTKWGKFIIATGQTLVSGTWEEPTNCQATPLAWDPTEQVWAPSGADNETVFNSWSLCADLTEGTQIDAREESGDWHLAIPAGTPGGS